MVSTETAGAHSPSLWLLEELLLALLGHTGDVFIKDAGLCNGTASSYADPARCTIKLADDIDWVSNAERCLLNEVVRLGYHYGELDAWAARRDAATLQARSPYLRALATGIAELLDLYRSAVLQLHRCLVADPTPLLSGVLHHLAEFATLLPPLHALLHQVRVKRLLGAALLRLLHSTAQCGIPALQSCLQRLLWHCNQVLFKQLAAWLVHGLLYDSHCEFFIQLTTQLPTAAPAQTGADGVGQSAPTSQALPTPHGAPAQDNEDAAEWHRGFQISLPVAETILFVGKSVRVLQRPGGVAQRNAAADIRAGADALQALQRHRSFDQAEFERTVDALKAQVSGQVWALLAGRGCLSAHLAALRDYFLLAKGDFFGAFLIESRLLFELPPRPATLEADLARTFQRAALNSNADADPLLAVVRLCFRQESKELSTSDRKAEGAALSGVPQLTRLEIAAPHGSCAAVLYVPGLDAWDGLALDCRVQWPLHMLLTPEVLAKYGAMFKYLLRLKRVQLLLEDAWVAMRERPAARRGSGPTSAARVRLWALRAQVAHFINNLQIYVQVDVIGAGYSQLQRRLESVHDFTEAERAHLHFLDCLVSQSFLDMRSLNALLTSVFAVCRRLCAMIQRDDGSVTAHAPWPECIAEMAAEFQAAVTAIYTMLRSDNLAKNQRAPYLRQFLLRLAFNGYVEAKGVREGRQQQAA